MMLRWLRENGVYVGIWTFAAFAVAVFVWLTDSLEHREQRHVARQCAILTTMSGSQHDSLVARLACDEMYGNPEWSAAIATQTAERLGR